MAKPRNDLTAEYVRSILDYDPETGVFTWKSRPDVGKTWNTKNAGKEAGTTVTKHHGNQYRQIIINRCPCYAHRLAWLYVTGEWPKCFIDHIDGDGINNCFSNLRLATSAENNRNRRRHPRSVSGLKGVTWDRSRRSWQSRIAVNGRQIHLGRFDTPEAAHAAYCKAAEQYHGEFWRGA